MVQVLSISVLRRVRPWAASTLLAMAQSGTMYRSVGIYVIRESNRQRGEEERGGAASLPAAREGNEQGRGTLLS